MYLTYHTRTRAPECMAELDELGDIFTYVDSKFFLFYFKLLCIGYF